MRHLCNLLFSSIVLVELIAPQNDAMGQQKFPVPDTPVQAQARQMAAEIYGRRFAEAKNPNQKTALAGEMLDAALKVEDGLPGQFVLLSIAREVAVAGGDASTAINAVGELARRFEVNTARMQGQSLLDAARQATATPQRKSVAESALAILPALADAGEYELALEVCEVGHAAATRGREYSLARKLAAKEEELKQSEKETRDYREALIALDKDPLDPDANLVAGRHLCFVTGDWDWGIPSLALGSDEELGTLAAKDLRGASTVTGQVALGDSWWTVAEGMKGPEREAALLRAGSWYRQSEPLLPEDLTGLRIRQRLKEISELGREIPASSQAPPRAVAPLDTNTARRRQMAWSRYLKVPLIYTNSIGMKLTLIPPGEFDMGSTEEEIQGVLSKARDRNGWMGTLVSAEVPKHHVVITQPFYLGLCEVTQQQYRSLMGVTPSRSDGRMNAPMGNVTWHDAVEFCRRLSALPSEGLGGESKYRLPTEAEWEYACRAGTTTLYYFGNDPTQLPRFAWFRGNTDEKPRPVGQLTPNAWGLLDMYGNVCEWCGDRFGPYQAGNSTDPSGPDTGHGRALRGLASVDADPLFFRSAFRHYREPGFRADHIGFRVVLTVRP